MINLFFLFLILILILIFLVHRFIFKDDAKKSLAKYKDWFVIPVVLCIIPIFINHNANIRHFFLCIQWLLIGFQYLGLYYQTKEFKILREKNNKEIIEIFEEHKKWLISCENYEEAKKYQDMINERNKQKKCSFKKMYISFLSYLQIAKNV